MPAIVLVACAAEEPVAPAVGPPNVLLISLDTVRADHTSLYGNARQTTPHLAALADRGTRFAAGFSQANESAYSHAALFTGRYASELADPDYQNYGIPDDATFVSEALQAYGYGTAMFSAGGHVTADFGFNQGWDHFASALGFGSLWRTAPGALQWIDQHEPDKPWFVFLHGYDAHRPYSRDGFWDHLYAQDDGSKIAELLARSPCLSEMVRGDALYPELTPSWFRHKGGSQIMDPASYDRLRAAPADAIRIPVTPQDRDHVQDHYDGALRYADTMLGLSLAHLEAGGHLDNTVVLVVADHGEDLLDHGFMNHRTGLWDSVTRVPMVAVGPGFAAGHTETSLVDARDVAATILAVAGARPPAGSGGRDLRQVGKQAPELDAVFIEGVMDMLSVRTQTHRLVFRGPPLNDPGLIDVLVGASLEGGAFDLYDLRTDPGEQINVASSQPGVAAELRDRLVRWRSSLQVGVYSLPSDQVSREASAAMKEHGYWDNTQTGDPAAPAVPAGPGQGVPTPPTGPMENPDLFCGERLALIEAAATP